VRQVSRDGVRDIRLLVALCVAATGVALSLAATGAPETDTGLQTVGKRLVLDIPDWLKLLVLLSLGFAALLVLGLLVRVPRKQPKDDNGHEHYYEPPKLTVRDYISLTLLGLSPLALAGAVLWFSHWLGSTGGVARAPTSSGLTSPGDALPRSGEEFSEPVLVHAPGVSALFGTVAILIAVAVLGFMLWLYFGGFLWWRSGERLGPVMAGLDKAVTASLDEVLRERDARRAIIKCYSRFETVLAAVHFARAPWETPLEFMRSVLQRWPLPHSAVRELTRLFELARFSEHPLEDREREIAVSSLRSISEALQKREAVDELNT
jgi:hypothetical protein